MKKKTTHSKPGEPYHWLSKQFDTHDPIAVTTEVLDLIQNEQAAIGMFKVLAALNQLAAGKNDDEGVEHCCGALRVLGAVYHHRKTIKEDWDIELIKRGSSFK